MVTELRWLGSLKEPNKQHPLFPTQGMYQLRNKTKEMTDSNLMLLCPLNTGEFGLYLWKNGFPNTTWELDRRSQGGTSWGQLVPERKKRGRGWVLSSCIRVRGWREACVLQRVEPHEQGKKQQGWEATLFLFGGSCVLATVDCLANELWPWTLVSKGREKSESTFQLSVA